MSALPTYNPNGSRGDYAQDLNPAPADAFAITPEDASDLPQFSFGIMVTATGTVKVDFAYTPGGGITLELTQGILYPFVLRKVYATGTTATGIIGFPKG